MTVLGSPEKPFLSYHLPRVRPRLLLVLLIPILLTFLFLSQPPPPAKHRPIQPPDLSRCLPIFLSSSPSLNCCSPIPSSPQILNFSFPSPSSPLRTRPAAHLVDDRYISHYSAALQLMKNLPSTDPRSFLQQANLHCAYCNGAYDQLGFPNLKLLIHNSWLFFPWHRLYLYFHERILGKLVGNDSFALPFWNWDSPEGMQMPLMYTAFSSPLYHPNRDPSHQPPVMLDLNFIDDQSRSEDDDEGLHTTVDNNLRIMYRQMMENGATTELFLGSAFRAGERPEPGAGSLEVVPHDLVHLWTGDPRKNHREDMGAFYSAARDPIFHAHHANIDRLWFVWKSLGRNHNDFSDPDWLDSAFLFYDEEARLVRARVRDCLDMDRLRYRYQEVENLWINSGGRAHRTKKKGGGVKDNYAEEVKFPVMVEKEAVVAGVKRPRRANGEEVELLVVEGIETYGMEFTRFDVYVNVSSAGSFVRLPRLKREGKGKTKLKLGISELIEDMGAGGHDTVTVTLVPRKGKATVDGLSIV